MHARSRWLPAALAGVLLSLSSAVVLAGAFVDFGFGRVPVYCQSAPVAPGRLPAVQHLEPTLLVSDRSAQFGVVRQAHGQDVVTTIARLHADEATTTVAAVAHAQELARDGTVTVAVLDVCGQSVSDQAAALERLYALALGFSPETRYRLVMCATDGSCQTAAEQPVRHPALLTEIARQRLRSEDLQDSLPRWKPVSMNVRLGLNHVVDVEVSRDDQPVSGAAVSVFSPPHFGCMAVSDAMGKAICTLEDMHPHGPDHVHPEDGHFLVATYRGSISAREVAPPMTAVSEAQLNFRFATPLLGGERLAPRPESLARSLQCVQAPLLSQPRFNQKMEE